VRRPAAFLMDEPLGALDAEFRESMRAEIKRLHIDQGATTVYVTHDQIEAMAMGDRIVIMSAAVVQQIGTPAEVYYDPANLFVARFIGSPGMNLLDGVYKAGAVHLPGGGAYTVPDDWRRVLDAPGALPADNAIVLGFRPEAVRVTRPGNDSPGELGAAVYADDLHGGYSMLHLQLADGVIVHGRAAREARHAIHSVLRFDLDPTLVRFFNPQTERAIGRDS